ncbi:hypothetical protein [Lapidilactobacillus luobeiensis]|uniref:hypothetical protein n=1 Tax=Lapidilactobacillus luobeiensis TaxID=2950371 RepID=UPI0021C4064C|nr:hypothetical protein [Lapidilactobacillus luobeiensis]
MKPEEQLSTAVRALLAQCREQIAPRQLAIVFSGPDSLVLNPTASKIIRNQANDLTLMVPNPRFANFIVAHELLHLQQEASQSVQVGPVRAQDEQLADFLAMLGQVIFETILHQAMRPRLLKMGVLDQPTQNAMREYISANLMREDQFAPGDEGTTVIGNALQFLDALTLLDPATSADTTWATDFPNAWALAQAMLTGFVDRPLVTNRQLRASLLRTLTIFKARQLTNSMIDLNRQLSVTAVLSSREMKLAVNQLFQLYHHPDYSELYLVIGKKDEQCVGVIEVAKEQQDPDLMQQLYARSIGDFVKAYQLPYASRDAHFLPADFPGESA